MSWHVLSKGERGEPGAKKPPSLALHGRIDFPAYKDAVHRC